MSVRCYTRQDAAEVLRLWNDYGDQIGYAPQSMEGLDELMLSHPNFCPQHSFILENKDGIHGFITGTSGEELENGKDTGYFTCLLLDDEFDTDEATEIMLTRLEDSFRSAGLTKIYESCFDPIHLPWIIAGTPGHQHNNMPAIPRDTQLYQRMQKLGYTEKGTEIAMYLNLKDFQMPEAILEKEKAMAQAGYTVDWYDESKHVGVDEMVESLHNSMWSAEVPAAAHSGMRLLVGLEGNRVAGFTGPVYPQPTGRGYFAGLAVGPAFEGHGLGKLLFYRLCAAEKECGSQYMSLFTGIDNHAQKIYKEIGFKIVRYYAEMLKEL